MNKKIYNKVFADCQAGGMSNDASHELAMEKACLDQSKLSQTENQTEKLESCCHICGGPNH